jgi:DNA polymerase gamma 1
MTHKPDFNLFNIQILPPKIQRALFGCDYKQRLSTMDSFNIIDEIESWGLMGEALPEPSVDFQMPSLEGENIVEHFKNISKSLMGDSLDKLKEFITTPLPARPEDIVNNMGWYRYADGDVRPVEYPLEDVIVFDTECLKSLDNYATPIIASAVTTEAWYIWLSPIFFGGKPTLLNIGKNKIIIGHNVSYDKARIAEEYELKSSGNIFVDTQALHNTIRGIGGKQRSYFNKIKKEKSTEEATWEMPENVYGFTPNWYNEVSPASLAECMSFYFNIKVNKTDRDDFTELNLSEIHLNLSKYIKYNVLDTLYTAQLFTRLKTELKSAVSYDFTEMGIYLKNDGFLPIDYLRWNKWISDNENKSSELVMESKNSLIGLAKELIYSEDDTPNFGFCPWINNDWVLHLDWNLNTRAKKMKGFSDWYKNIWIKNDDKCNSESKLSAETAITPYLLQLKWRENPLMQLTWIESPDGESRIYILTKGLMVLMFREMFPQSKTFSRELAGLWQNQLVSTLDKYDTIKIGDTKWTANHNFLKEQKSSKRGEEKWTQKSSWGYIINPDTEEFIAKEHAGSFISIYYNQAPKFIETSPTTVETDKGNYRWYYVPHKAGLNANCGNPLAKDYINAISQGVLTSVSPFAESILQNGITTSYWISIKKRVNNQVAHPVTENGAAIDKLTYGIIPTIKPVHTLTRRCGHELWLVAANCKEDKIGSNLKSQVVAPDGYVFIGTDIDSEEVRLAALVGEIKDGEYGSSPFGQQVLRGTKKLGTDFHTITSNIVNLPNISRDICKVINYSRLYGAGEKATVELLLQADKSLTTQKAKEIVKILYLNTKGKRTGYPGKKWVGGTESAAFNYMEHIATQPVPKSAVNRVSFPYSLQPKHVGTQFITSRINCVIQSSGSDFLDNLLIATHYLYRKNGLEYRFIISIHDEVHFMVKKEDAIKAAYLLQIAHAWTWTFVAYQWGFNTLPNNFVWSSEIDVDKYLRKDIYSPENTLANTQNLPPGKGYSMAELLKTLNIEHEKA